MAKYRNVSVKFWSDQFVAEELTPEKRYFFLYLLTNEHTAQCGIYEVTVRQMAFETGYNNETVERLLRFFEEHGKIKWSKETNEIAIKNFVKYNPQGSPKVKVFVNKEMAEVKNKDLINFIESANLDSKYPIDPLSQREEEEEREEELKEEENKEDRSKKLKEDFRVKLIPFVGDVSQKNKYRKEMIRDFFDYWTETNESGKKMRFEAQKFFDIARRLRTWASREKSATPKTLTTQLGASPFNKREIHA